MANRTKTRSRVAGTLWRSLSPAAILLPSAALLGVVGPAVGQIYTTGGQLIPGTQEITPGPGVDLSGWNMSGHELEYANLGAPGVYSSSGGQYDLTGASFANSDLSYANFVNSTLTNADFTGAIVLGASFGSGNTNGLTASQLYSTASYVADNLSGISFIGDNLSGWNFAGQNLSNANLSATLANANFSGAIITGASFTGTTLGNDFTASQLYSTASYANANLTGIKLLYNIDLRGWDFSNQNLSDTEFSITNSTNTSFANANLTNAVFEGSLAGANLAGADLTNAELGFVSLGGANFKGATIAGADLKQAVSEGFTSKQLYSTASYATHNLVGIQLHFNDLTGWIFVSQNLANAGFFSTTLTNTDFADADLRGATAWSPVASTVVQNTIQPNGSIAGLVLQAGETLTIHNNPIPVTVQTTATFDPASTLQFQFDQNWTSPVGFATGVTPAFNGTLDLELASDVAPGNLLGTTFQLFNFSAPLAANNQFASTTTAPGYTFNLSNLYTTGTATLTGVPAVTVGSAVKPATLQLPGGVGLMTTSSLTINPGSTLDITNNALAINYTPGNSPAAAIRQWLTTGYANDTWIGPGIDSSAAALNPGSYAIGYADGNVDEGTSAAPDQVLVEYTLAGDANLDGAVNFADLLVVAQNFNHTLDTHGNPIDWADGDFNYDGNVNFADLLLVAQNFNQTLTAGQLTQLPGSFSAAWNLALADVQEANTNNVPEPASAALLAVGSGLLLRRKRKMN